MRPSKTIADELTRYGVGAKVRRLRLRKKISLVELGRHTGLSAALLSKLERDQVMPTLPTLIRIALVFGVGLEHFFASDAEAIGIVRREDRLRFPERPKDPDSTYQFECLDFVSNDRKLNAYWAEFLSRDGEPRVHAHDAAEVIYVLKGQLRLHTAAGSHTLNAGDSVYLPPGVIHGYVRESDEPCEAVVVTSAADVRSSTQPADDVQHERRQA